MWVKKVIKLMALRPATNVTLMGLLLAPILFLPSTLLVISGDAMEQLRPLYSSKRWDGGEGELELGEQRREPENERKDS